MKSHDELISLIIHKPDYFNQVKHLDLFIGEHKIIFDEMKKQAKYTEATLFDSINNNKLMSTERFMDICDILTTESNFRIYYDKVFFDYVKRESKNIMLKMNEYDTPFDVKCDIDNIFENSTSGDEVKKADYICQEALENRYPKKVYSGVQFLDVGEGYNTTGQGGYDKDELIILAARPSEGKTSKALELIKRQLKKGMKVLLFSAEMSRVKIMKILACSIAGLDLNEVEQKKITEDQEQSLVTAYEYLYEKELWVDESRHFEDIVRISKQMVKKHKIDVIYVDHLHELTTYQKFFNTVEKLKHMTKEFKQQCRQLKTPLVLLAQLNRGTGERPTKSDLKGCGDIEESADIILLMHKLQDAINGNANQRLIEVIIDKNRNGKVGSYKRTFQTDARRYIKGGY